MKPTIIRQVSFKKALFFTLNSTVMVILYASQNPEELIIYLFFWLCTVIIAIILWHFSKTMEITEDTFTFKNSVFNKSRSIPIFEIEVITPRYVSDNLLYLNIVLTTGESVKMTAVSDEVLRVLKLQNLLSS